MTVYSVPKAVIKEYANPMGALADVEPLMGPRNRVTRAVGPGEKAGLVTVTVYSTPEALGGVAFRELVAVSGSPPAGSFASYSRDSN